ncbi:MAG: extracellular solute-binding protein [Rhizobiales bacterium]|nr:extracellular solute-binding protein [Hyphomicrobiales bacterium]
MADDVSSDLSARADATTNQATSDQGAPNRRDVLKSMSGLALAGTSLIASPMIIGRASPASAQSAFAGEQLIVVSWSGNHEQLFRETIIPAFNDRYKTKVETVGGWDQMITQIKAAPEDNPPFDITIGDEYISSSGLAEKVFLQTDRAKVPNLESVYPWFYETRSKEAGMHGVPFGGGTPMLILRKSLGIEANSWEIMWDDRLAGKVTLDAGTWWWSLSLPAIVSSAAPGLSELYGWPDLALPLYEKLDKLKVARWFKDGAEQANILNQEEADAGVTYSTDAYTYIENQPDEYFITIPKEGTSAWTDWFFKVRGTRHGDLADTFLNFILEKEVQESFINKSLVYMSRQDIAVPPHWQQDYPSSNDELRGKFNIITMDGWDKITASWEAMENRFKETVVKTTAN